MADYLQRLAERTLGIAPVTQPVLAPLFEPQGAQSALRSLTAWQASPVSHLGEEHTSTIYEPSPVVTSSYAPQQAWPTRERATATMPEATAATVARHPASGQAQFVQGVRLTTELDAERRSAASARVEDPTGVLLEGHSLAFADGTFPLELPATTGASAQAAQRQTVTPIQTPPLPSSLAAAFSPAGAVRDLRTVVASARPATAPSIERPTIPALLAGDPRSASPPKPAALMENEPAPLVRSQAMPWQRPPRCCVLASCSPTQSQPST